MPNAPKHSAGEDLRATAIVVAGGRGTRMGGGGTPKQYRNLLGVPMLCHTLSRFEAHPAVRAIILVIRPQDEDLCNNLVSPSSYGKVRAVVPGGATRLDSVCAGLAASCEEDDLLLVHDAVRPCPSDDLITAVVDAAARHGAVIPAVAATDTIKEVDDTLTVVATPALPSLLRTTFVPLPCLLLSQATFTICRVGFVVTSPHRPSTAAKTPFATAMPSLHHAGVGPSSGAIAAS